MRILAVLFLTLAAFPVMSPPRPVSAVSSGTSSTSVTSSPNPSVAGQTVTFTASVIGMPPPGAPPGTMPGGPVTFTISGGPTLIGMLIIGTAMVTIPDLSVGSHTVTATYSGDPNFAGSSGTTTHTVKGSTATTVSQPQLPSVFGQPVTFSATVTAVAPASGTPTGSVSFAVSGGPTLTGTLDASGQASATTSALPVGSHTVTVTYGGNTDFAGSSGTATYTVNQGTTTTTVTSSPDPSVVGQAVTIAATVTAAPPSSGTPTGTVSFVVDGGSPITATLDASGQATSTAGALSLGSRTVTATYSGDTNFTGSSGTTVQTVNPGSTTTTVTSSPDPSVVGQTVTFTATVTAAPPASGTPVGQVIFQITGPTPVTLLAFLAGGTATVSTSALTAGPYTVVASFGSDMVFQPSTGTDTHTVLAPPSINGYNPPVFAAGDTLTIHGQNFTGVTAVSFNGIAATSFTVVSPTEITAVVPAGGTVGSIKVTATAGTGSFVIPRLVVTRISPARPAPNTPFEVTVETRDGSDLPLNVTQATTVTLSKTSGAGTLGGTLALPVAVGQSSVKFTGLTLDQNTLNVQLTAVASGGDPFRDGVGMMTVSDQPMQMFVNSTLDKVDVRLGDNSCNAANLATRVVEGQSEPSYSLQSSTECTLRAAVMEANESVAGAVINVQPGTYTLTIAPAGVNDAATGDLNISSPALVTIQRQVAARMVEGTDDGFLLLGGGAPAGPVIVQAGPSAGAGIDRLFHVKPGAKLALNGLTVQYGKPTGLGSTPMGGAIYDQGALTLTDTSVLFSTSLAHGGGIAVDTGATFAMTGGTAGNNSTNAPGGGIYSMAPIALTNVTISNNTTGNGGGLYLEAGAKLTMTGGSITGNAASGPGGGIESFADLDLTNVTVSFNTATAIGGGIYLPSGTLKLNGGSVVNNTSDGPGGGVDTAVGGEISGAVISGNTSKVIGGGIHSEGPLRITASTIANNTAVAPGGGVFSTQLTLINSTVSGNTSTVNPGGGIFANAGMIVNSTIVGNSSPAALGGGVSGPLTVANSIIANNTAPTFPNCMPGIVSQGANIEGGTDCMFIAAGDKQNVTDLKLGPLEANGGATLTHALLPGSPALNAGNPTVCTGADVISVDQRGMSRVTAAGPACDIGAFERVQPGVKLAVTQVAPPAPVQNAAFPVKVEVQDGGNAPVMVNTDTQVTLLVKPGAGNPGALLGTVMGTIRAGQNHILFDKVIYNLPAAPPALVLQATSLPGDMLTMGESVPFTVHGTAKYLVTVDPQGPAAAGSMVTVTAQAVTVDNEVVPLPGVAVTWSNTGMGGVFLPAVSITDPFGRAVVQFTVSTMAGTTHTVKATDAGSLTGISTPFGVAPAAPAKYQVRVQPAMPVAGAPVTVAAQLQDAFNNNILLAGRNVTWGVALGAGGSYNPVQSPTNGQGTATTQFTTSATAGVTYTLTALDGQNAGGTSDAFTTQASVALRLETNPPAAMLGGNAVQVRILAEAGALQVDAAQLRLTFNPAQLQIVDADGQGGNGVNLQPGPAFTQGEIIRNSADNGAGSIALAVSRKPDQAPLTGTILLATAWVQGLAVGQNPVSFDPPSVEVAFAGLPLGHMAQNGMVEVRAKGLRFVQQPVRGAHGVVLGTQPAVALTDSTGAILTDDSITVVTLNIRPGTGSAGAALICTQTAGGVTQVTMAGGIAAFSGCLLNQSGAGFQLEAVTAAPDVAGARSGRFNITWAGDTDGNCRVSVVDISLIVTHYGKTNADPAWLDPALRAFRADLDGDDRVGVLDFSTTVSRFGQVTTGCAVASQPVVVTITNTGVAPANVTVAAGQTVLWRNSGPGAHTTTAGGGLWRSSLLAAQQSFGYVFESPGTFTYHSTAPGDTAQVGTITVTPQIPS